MIKSARTPNTVPRAIGNTRVDEEGVGALDVDAGDEEVELEVELLALVDTDVGVTNVVMVSSPSRTVKLKQSVRYSMIGCSDG